MNEIAQRQNEEHFIQMLAAQRQLYSDHKRQVNLWVLIALGFAILGAGAPSMLKVPIAIGSVLLVVLEFIFMPMINNQRKQAAQIQELFDTELLELPWNYAMATKPPAELIAKYAKKQLRGNPAEVERKRNALHNWYDSPDVPTYPLYQARIIAQRQNIWWDAEQRRTYINWLTMGVLALITVLVVVGFLPTWDLQQFNPTPLLLFLPLIVITLKNLAEQRNAADRLDLLHAFVQNLWNDAVGDGSDNSKKEIAALEQRSRELQNEIYYHRSQNPPVLDWVYNRLKTPYGENTQTAGFLTG